MEPECIGTRVASNPVGGVKVTRIGALAFGSTVTGEEAKVREAPAVVSSGGKLEGMLLFGANVYVVAAF